MKINKLINQRLNNEKAICAYFENTYKYLYENDLHGDYEHAKVVYYFTEAEVSPIKKYHIASGDKYIAFGVNVLGKVDRVWHYKLGFFYIKPIPKDVLFNYYKKDARIKDLNEKELNTLRGYYEQD